ncbi:MAG: DNA polymerase III subunit delta [Clostridia bacterium]|nr:DNA polymerase III subunit delta [Clostridia bacterium]
MTIENLEKELKEKKLNSIYLLYGEELYLLESNLKKIKTLFGECIKGINYILIDEQNVSEIISDIETPSFGYEKKLIIARNTGLLKKEGKKKSGDLSKIKDKLEQYIDENIKIINESVILVFIEEEADTKSKLYKTIEKNGVVCKFDYQKPLQIEQRIKSICNAYKVQIDSATIRYFIECCGTNMQDLINEIRKLIEYAGENGTIKKEDIDKLSIKKLESVIFDLTDDLGKKDISGALQVLKNLIYAKEPLAKILVTLYNHFKKIYITKIALNTNKDLASSLKLKPNQAFLTNKYKMQSKYFKENELRAILQELCDLDYNFKSGKIDLQVGLETILCRYCS